MIPLDLHDFLTACIGASASFIGLLFVGLSVVSPKNESDERLTNANRLRAESTYAGLINIFFVALVGILPHGGIAYVSITMAVIGLLNAWRVRRLGELAQIGPLVISILVYLLEFGYGIELALDTGRPVNIGIFQAIIISLFAISLIQAWGLTGIRQGKSGYTRQE